MSQFINSSIHLFIHSQETSLHLQMDKFLVKSKDSKDVGNLSETKTENV